MEEKPKSKPTLHARADNNADASKTTEEEIEHLCKNGGVFSEPDMRKAFELLAGSTLSLQDQYSLVLHGAACIPHHDVQSPTELFLGHIKKVADVYSPRAMEERSNRIQALMSERKEAGGREI